MGAIGYHEITAAAHVPTAYSVAYPLSGIMVHAGSGLADIARAPKDEFNHPNRERLNSFNAIGVGAHLFFSTQKAFIYRLKNAALNAGKLKEEFHSGSSVSHFDKYEADMESYQTRIRESLDDIEMHIEQKRSNDFYKGDLKIEHLDRNRYIEEITKEFILPQDVTTKQQAIKAKLNEMQAIEDVTADKLSHKR